MSRLRAWGKAPSGLPELVAGDVDVWSVQLDCSPAYIAVLLHTLSEDECERADRFYFERDRRRFTCARGALRRLLAAYLDTEPSELTFSYGPNGKPALSGRFAHALTFNVSHSHELALVAIGRDVEMGVDVEAVRSMNDADDIASRFFSPRETAQLRALPDAVRTEAFFACWTRKEAYLKALGSGLAKPLDEFDVAFAPGESPALCVHGDERETARWSIRGLAPAPGYTGALVTESGGGAVRCWQWTDMCTGTRARADVSTMEAV
jgi:4'-phosphopantetheinyl transferase